MTGIGRDTRGLYHSRIQIRNVYIINNHILKEVYIKGHAASVQRLRQLKPEFIEFYDICEIPATTSLSNIIQHYSKSPAQTSQILLKIKDLPLDFFNLGTGEVLLFHGTPRSNVPSILKQGFKAEKNTRPMYGKGTYLTDSSQKADQYTDKFGPGMNTGLTMFLVRAALGRTLSEVFGILEQCDTIVDGERKLFKKFVVKKDECLLPQLLIEYDRV